MKTGVRMVRNISITLIMALACGLVLPGFIANRWPVDLVSVEGLLNPGERQEIRAAIASHLNKGFLFVNLDEVVKSVMQLSWPREVEVHRKWPANLLISVKKQSIVARWNGTDYLTTSGQVVNDPDMLGENLPNFYAEHSDGIRTMGVYRDLNRINQDTGLKITELHEDAQGGWRLEFESSFVLVLGRESLNARMDRFVSAFSQGLRNKKQQMLSVDARYRNGVAVMWAHELPGGELVTSASNKTVGNGHR